MDDPISNTAVFTSKSVQFVMIIFESKRLSPPSSWQNPFFWGFTYNGGGRRPTVAVLNDRYDHIYVCVYIRRMVYELNRHIHMYIVIR